MSAAFTPGPWEFARGVNEYGCKGGPILGSITKGGTWHIAVLPSDLGSESEANARLIAAAPELYEALTDALANVECLDGDKCPHWCEWHNTARAAIAKARATQTTPVSTASAIQPMHDQGTGDGQQSSPAQS